MFLIYVLVGCPCKRKWKQLLCRLTRKVNENTASETSQPLSVGCFFNPRSSLRLFYNFSAHKIVRSTCGKSRFLATDKSIHEIVNTSIMWFVHFKQDSKTGFKIGSFINSIRSHHIRQLFCTTMISYGWQGHMNMLCKESIVDQIHTHQSPKAIFAQINSFHFKKLTFYPSICPFLFWREK